jgi:hypothetical protein
MRLQTVCLARAWGGAALVVFVLTAFGGLALVGAARWQDAQGFLGLAVPVEGALWVAAGRYLFGRGKGE